MAYSKVATGATPALVIYLLDCSGSMNEKLDGEPKIKHLNEALGRVLERMVQRSTKGEVISPRYRLALIAYSDQPRDILGGVKTINEVVNKGKPKLSASMVTNTEAAFTYARDLLRQELPQLAGHPAPMVCHLTDGQFTGNDPEPIAQEIMQMSNDDGNVLVENIFVAPDLTRQPITDSEAWPGISDAGELQDAYAVKLFNMSSALPASYAEVIRADSYSLRAGCRMLIPGANKDLVELAFTMSGATPVR
jgi:uncharacterized protein YegL